MHDPRAALHCSPATSSATSSATFSRASLLASALSSLGLCMALVACSDAPAPKPPTRPAPSNAVPPAAATQPPASNAAAPAASTPAAAANAGVDPSKWRTSTSADDPAVLEVAGFRAPKPAAWVWTKPSMQFRTLQYAIPGEGDSTLGGELIVSVFVAGDGGPIDANITRWKSQFRVGDAPPEPVLSSKEVGPLKVQFVELAGDFMAMGAPAPKKDFLQLAAIVQAEGRNVFFRLVGPKPTIEANRDAFMKMIDGLMPAD